MNEAIEQIRSLLRHADQALSRQAQPIRTPKQREEDFAEARHAHHQAVAILDALSSQRELDEAMVAALAPLHVDVADLAILIAEIRFDEVERAYHHHPS